jgi:predicted small secreted protein
MKHVMIAFVAFAGLPGCETVQGAGKDIQKAGQAIEKSAN